MHRCLLINEILTNIISQAASTENRIGSPTVAKLSRVCQAFKEPCLDKLWHNLPSLFPLLKLFPSDAWKLKWGEGLGGDNIEWVDEWHYDVEIVRFEFTRALDASDWSRFNAFAPRVRSLWQGDDGERDEYPNNLVPISTLQHLCLHRTTLKILPNLRSLQWTDSREEVIQYMSLFLSEKCTHILVNSGSEATNVDPQLLPHLVTTCPNLEEFVAWDLSPQTIISLLIPPGRGFESSTSTFSQPNFPLLRKLESHTVVPSTILSYFRFHPRLTDLGFQSADRGLPDLNDASSFQHLRNLSMEVPAINEAALNFLRGIRSPHVEQLRLTTYRDNHCSSTIVHRTCAVASQFLLLQDLHIEIWSTADAPNPEAMTSIPSSHPIFSLRHIQRLYLTVSSLDWDDTTIATLAKSFPNLETLELIPRYKATKYICRPQVTIAGIESLVQHCPMLEDLGIHIDTANANSACQRSNVTKSDSSMKHLFVGASLAPHPDRVASILVAYFPRLSSVTAWDGSTDCRATNARLLTSKQQWLQVGHLVTQARRRGEGYGSPKRRDA
ncbi:hypothetical protein HGRIS_007525 [Hohenbuehelia grisea]|uniref:F-box domain-containing protein n=1 Tax=Hohenbuehelia grisea TaxID=104357 RepID=A0ABR3J5A6_9AGAR